MAAEIFGTLYDDVDRSGTRNNGENGLSGWTVFLDLNRNDTRDAGEPTTLTDRNGDYRLTGLAAGNYRVAEILVPGWTPTSPISKDVSVATDQKSRADFFVFGGGDVRGTVWNDLNNDGILDPTEPGLAGWTVFLDRSPANTVLDPGEPSVTTDANGHYEFLGLAAGDYEVTEVLPIGWDVSDVPGSDWKQTVEVVALQVSTQNFGNVSFSNGSIRGTVFNDLNADAMRNIDATTGDYTEPGLSGWTVFVDLNSNNVLDATDLSTTTDPHGVYNFVSLDAGDYEVIELLPDSWDVSPGTDSKQTVQVQGGQQTVADDFANFTVLNGSISGTVWNDVNRNGARDFDALTGLYLEPGLSGWQVFVDLNRNLVADAGEPTQFTNTNGEYEFLDLQVGDYKVQEVVPSGWEVAPTFDDRYTVTVFSGSNSVAEFANYNAADAGPGSLSGVIWNDLDGDGVRESSEPMLSGWNVYLDANNDGVLSVGEPEMSTASDGGYRFDGVAAGTVTVRLIPVTGWRATSPSSNNLTVTLRGGQILTGQDFGRAQLNDSSISGVVFADSNKNGARELAEKGLSGITVYLDLNNNDTLDSTEPSMSTSGDEYYTPTIDEAGSYSFTHLAIGTYVVKAIIPEILSATPSSERSHTVTVSQAEDRVGINTAAVYRPTEIRGVKFEDSNGNHLRDAGEAAIPNATIFVDLNRNNALDSDEPATQTLSDGSYVFTDLASGAYVVRELVSAGYTQTAPATVGGILWPTGSSNAAAGNVSPTSITTSLKQGERYSTNVSITLPNSGALTQLVDVFLLFDDTGSFVNNSPIVRAAFPDIIAQLTASLPGIDLGFGVGRFEEYANFAYEYDSGRPFTLNQPIVAASSAGYMTAIQAALDRTAPGYGGDEPETDIEALYQLVTGRGFDGNNNGSVLDSGPSGLAATQLNPGASGDVPSFASFVADPANSVMPAAGKVGGAGFRSGALPIVLLATDTGFAYQPKGETSIVGAGGLTLPISDLTQTSRNTTPDNLGAGIQETITGLNALGALVIGLGTNADSNVDPRQQLESISKLTGTINQTASTIANGTTDPIAPGDPMYFEIASGFSSSVANGVVSAIKNAVSNVAVDIEVRASDPRVRLTSLPGVRTGIGSGMTASFDIEIVGDGAPRRFDLQFVRAGTNVVLGSIPVVLGTPINGDGYHFDELEDGEVEVEDDFGDYSSGSHSSNTAPSFTKGIDLIVLEDAGTSQYVEWATNISAGSPSEAGQALNFIVSNSNASLFTLAPAISSTGTLTFTPAPNANGVAVVTVLLHDNGGTADGGVDTSASQVFTISITPVNDAPAAALDNFVTSENTNLIVALPGVLANDADIDSSSLEAVLALEPTHGTVSLNADGSFIYHPNTNFNGEDSFTYTAFDGLLYSATATVSISVSAVNDAPKATDDTYATPEDSSLTVPAVGVLANDLDSDSSTLTSILVAGSTHGTVSLNPDGSFTYAPNANFNGVDSFSYKVSDGALESNTATVRLTVSATNDTPLATNDTFVTTQGTLFSVIAPGVLTNDSDIDGDNLRALMVSPTANGSVVLNADGSFAYTPNAGFTGTDSFVYQVNDGAANSSNATVSIDVRPVAGGTKFLVVDNATDKTYKYDAAGVTTGRENLFAENKKPRGIAASKDGTTHWVVDADGEVFVYNASGARIGTWKTTGIDKPEGITTNGTDIWIVDQEKDAVYYFAGAALRRSGTKAPTSSFPLTSANRNPSDLVTDGNHIWVVNNTTTVDRVFRYSKAGTLEGTWTIDGRNSSPTGITIDPNELSSIWIVDSGTDSVYHYRSATNRLGGSQSAADVFGLVGENVDPQGIADPPSTSLWTNTLRVADVNDDGEVTPLDALLVVNTLRIRERSESLGIKQFEDGFLDVNHDSYLSPVDALAVVNELHRLRSSNQKSNATDAALFSMYDSTKEVDSDSLFDWFNLDEDELSPTL